MTTSSAPSCLGDEGLGNGENPPVWGAMPFNQGTGLAKDVQLAA
ncbi:MAG: hypothetical protein WKF77_03170 [Planctomycetaceae bacterium]